MNERCDNCQAEGPVISLIVRDGSGGVYRVCGSCYRGTWERTQKGFEKVKAGKRKKED